MMKNRIFRLFWVLLVAISSFTLGYTLKPSTSRRPPALDLQSMGSRFQMPVGGIMPPANFRRR